MTDFQTRRSRATEPGVNRKHHRLGGLHCNALAALCGADARRQFIDAMREADIDRMLREVSA